jgi:hypothetical protein
LWNITRLLIETAHHPKKSNRSNKKKPPHGLIKTLNLRKKIPAIGGKRRRRR